ncbi:BamA/TamA family outer membrane protein [Solitalea koreensis]|uniref:Surface antigen n=1 Tax=Solitalea koreensis TaxID=543615 RepID=A0A521C4W6_9SPHI|nr:BamA/TamA family outer membrane protein [Solitalea koreensis]SMO54462.1 Surface antigen [Solitalea koreensis]
MSNFYRKIIEQRAVFLIIHLFILLQHLPFSSAAQDTSAVKNCPQQDLTDLISKWRNKPPKVKPDTGKNAFLLLFPVIGSNPATGFQIGAAGQYAFKGKNTNSLYSTVVGNLTYTTKNQLLLQIKNNVYAKNNKVFLSGDWRLFIFSQSTYGLGTNAPEGGVLDFQFGLNGSEVNTDSLVQPMKYNQIRFYQTASFKLKNALFAGIGYHLDWYDKIEDQKLDTANHIYTSHYVYSTFYGFDPKSYLVSGLSVNLLVDTRDNLLNPYKGYFASINYWINPKFLGNEKTSNLLSVEWRSYHSLSKTNPRHLISFWLLGNFSPPGEFPYLNLPALGYDQRGRSGRGYSQGRFRGTNMIYAETEYRFPISRCSGILGGILFANMTTADTPDKSVKLFDYVQPGYGLGLRVMIDKRSRTNLQVDMGFGNESGALYLGAGETF